MSAATRATSGAAIRHGPHHAAQKSTSTGTGAFVNDVVKRLSVHFDGMSQRRERLLAGAAPDLARKVGGLQAVLTMTGCARDDHDYRSRIKLFNTKFAFAGRSPSRRMKYGNHSRPNGT